ncbi:MAG: ArsB/NhaD family transporter, partial [Actinomycetota bacterium]|nr:ArsB/NhaD family transporter [Actinomycetota bacterium]
MLMIGATDGDAAFYSEETGIDWNVIFLLLGMMVIVSVVKQTGVFEYLAIWAAKQAQGRPYRVLVLLCTITAVASAALDNVTTVLLVAPVTLLVCDRIGVRPEGFLIAEALASNIGGAATLIGDPPNIIIASRADLSFNDFLVNMGPIVVVLMGVFLLLARWLFRRSFTYDAGRAAAVMDLDERAAIRDRTLLVRCLLVLVAVLVGFSLHTLLHIDPSVVALLGAGVLVLVSGTTSEEFLEDVEWETLVFFAGLFVMVGTLVNVGVIEYLGEQAVEAVDGRYLLASTGLLFGSAVISGIVDNIPYVATVSPLVNDLVESGDNTPKATAMWWALALGADLGGNATAVGASANVVVTGIAARSGHPISFWHFTKYGLVVTAVTIALAWPYVWLRYYAYS